MIDKQMFSSNNFIVEGKGFLPAKIDYNLLPNLNDRIFEFMYNKGYDSESSYPTIFPNNYFSNTFILHIRYESTILLKFKKFVNLITKQEYFDAMRYQALINIRDDWPHNVNFLYRPVKKDKTTGLIITIRSEPAIISKMHQLKLKPELNILEYNEVINKSKTFLEEIMNGLGFQIIEKPKVLKEYSVSNDLEKVICVSPIFKIPDDSIKNDCVAVMMPFKMEFDKVYDSIKETCSNVGLHCHRADDFWKDSMIINDVYELIYRSSMIIADFSGKNENVFYEAGIAHTLGKNVIPITQNRSDIPFDLQHHRHIEYLANNEGLIELNEQLEKKMIALKNNK